MNYEEYSKQRLDSLVGAQEKFKEIYKIDLYANWFYDSELELLRLYNNDEDEVYFKYIPVGTYSLRSKTWMWSWYNSHSIEKNKTELLAVKEFGIENNYEKLYKGTFPSDEYDGWELSSICFDHLKAIGVYKVNTDDLEQYVLVINVLDEQSSDVKMFRKKKVDCESHGYSRPAFVCQHLDLEIPKGFEEAFDTYKGMELEEDEDFQAWCSECEKIRGEYDGWNEESERFAGITLVCENCYFELKEFNNIRL